MDRIGPHLFIKLSKPPERASRHWQIVRKTGVNGSALWDTGEAGEPFIVSSETFATSFAAGRASIIAYQALELAGAVPVWFGTLEPLQLYKVLRVVHADVKSIIRGKRGGDSTNYQALVFADWELLPINPLISKP